MRYLKCGTAPLTGYWGTDEQRRRSSSVNKCFATLLTGTCLGRPMSAIDGLSAVADNSRNQGVSCLWAKHVSAKVTEMMINHRV